MAPIGGSIEAVTLDGRTFPATTDADAQIKLGGWENEVQANGDGSTRLVKTRVPNGITGLVLSIDQSRGDSEFLQDLQDLKGYFAASLTLAGGSVWQGVMQIVDETVFNTQASTANVAVMGEGRMSRQTVTV